MRRADLTSKQLILEPLASSLAVLSDEEKEAGVCLVDIGGGTTDVAIFYENIIRHYSGDSTRRKHYYQGYQRRMHGHAEAGRTPQNAFW